MVLKNIAGKCTARHLVCFAGGGSCQGLATASERQGVLNFNKEKGYSILCLKDTHFTEEKQFVETHWG